MKQLVVFDLDGTLAASKSAMDEEMITLLSLLPTCGTKFYTYGTAWEKLYSEDLTHDEKNSIVTQINSVVKSLGFIPEKTWGEVIEDRGSQITFSALGQDAPLQKKIEWDADFSKRKKIQELLGKSIPEFSVRLGGTTSVDVTNAGVDKAYGIGKLVEILHIDKSEMMFMGDAIFPGGNDYAVKETGVSSIQVKDPNETKKVIGGIITYLT